VTSQDAENAPADDVVTDPIGSELSTRRFTPVAASNPEPRTLTVVPGAMVVLDTVTFTRLKCGETSAPITDGSPTVIPTPARNAKNKEA
jgi:hypothetical protein